LLELELQVQPSGKVLKPKTKFVLSCGQKNIVYKWISELKMPDGYTSNLHSRLSCDVAGTKNGRIYGLGIESTVIVGRPYYYSGSSSSNRWVQSQELDEPRKDLEVVKKERDELRTKIVNIEKLFQENNVMIRRWMDDIHRHLCHQALKKLKMRMKDNHPVNHSILAKVILLHYPSFYKYISVRFLMILLNSQT